MVGVFWIRSLNKIHNTLQDDGMTDRKERMVWSSPVLFSRSFFAFYDWVALGCHCRWIWQCRASYILEFYNRHVSGNHLDIGTGTGYFPDKCRFPVPNPRLALLDINPHSLVRASGRLKRHHPQVFRKNILEPLALDGQRFDSIGLTHVLHCLPGNMESKEVVFRNLLPLINPDGIVFGTTFLYRETRHSFLAESTFRWANQMKIMSNLQDSREGLERILHRYFRESHIEICGCEALFWGKGLIKNTGSSEKPPLLHRHHGLY
jgi:ubiquinone/menaquinone biosynthesis C-methylase UbiE